MAEKSRILNNSRQMENPTNAGGLVTTYWHSLLAQFLREYFENSEIRLFLFDASPKSPRGDVKGNGFKQPLEIRP